MPKHKLINRGKLERMQYAARRAGTRRHPKDGPSLIGFSGDHGNLLIRTSAGLDLYAEHTGDRCRYEAARVLQYCDPKTVEELVRGYWLALDIGLLDHEEPPTGLAKLSPLAIDRLSRGCATEAEQKKAAVELTRPA